MDLSALRELHLQLGLLQSLLDAVLIIGSSAPQPLLQNLRRRGLEEEKARIELVFFFDLLDTLQHPVSLGSLTKVPRWTDLHLDVQDTYPSPFSDVFHSLDTRAIVIPAKLCVLNKTAIVDQVEELFLCGEIVLAAILLAATRIPCGVFGIRFSNCGGIEKGIVQLRDMEKPKVSG